MTLETFPGRHSAKGRGVKERLRGREIAIIPRKTLETKWYERAVYLAKTGVMN